LFFKKLVIDSSSGSSSIPSYSSSSKQTHSNPNEVKDVGRSNQAIDLASRLPHCPNYEWVDPCVLDIPTCFRGSFALDGFLSKVSMLKSNSNNCNHTDQVSHRENGSRDFFFAYTCLFNDLHVTHLFDEFEMGVLEILNVAHT